MLCLTRNPITKKSLTMLSFCIVIGSYINLSTGEIGGKIKFLSGSSGLENVQGWNDMLESINDAISSAENANTRAESLEFLKSAISGSTDVQGGLLLSNMMMLKNLAGAIVAGMSGITGDNVFLFADEDGGYQKAMNKKSMFLLSKDGTANIGLLKVSKNSIAICEKLIDEQGRFNGLGNEIVRFQDTPIPPFTDLISHVNASVNYYGGTMIHSGAKTGSFGYSDLLIVSGVESFSLKVTGTLYVFVNNDYYTPISDSFCSAALVLYRYENGVYTHERVVDNISIYESVPGVFQDTKQVDISFGLSSGTYAIRGEYVIQTKGTDSAELNIRDFRLTASGSSANKCLIFGSNGFVRIKDGENYTYISDSMVAMKGLPSSVGVVGSGQLYRDSNNFIKVS